MDKKYIDILQYEEEGYKPMIDFEKWRVAVLRYCEELEVQNLKTMQKHSQSDEVFVLLEGNCTLFSGEQGDNIGNVDAVALEPLKMFNVKKGTWHTHTLDKNATVLIVENQNTCDDNSPTLPMTEEQIAAVNRLFTELCGSKTEYYK